jgi:hypothetical protein
MLTLALGFPILGLALMLQMVAARTLNLLYGSADIVMLMIIAWVLQKKSTNSWDWALIGGIFVGGVSALPLYVPIVSYLFVAGFAKIFQKRVWQTPILAMFFITGVGSLVFQFISVFGLQIAGVPLIWGPSIRMVIIPSVLLNLLLAFPVFALVTNFSGWLHLHEVEE